MISVPKGMLLVALFLGVSTTPLQARTEKSALEVVVLGSGGPRAFGRAGSSYLLILDGVPRVWWMPGREHSCASVS